MKIALLCLLVALAGCTAPAARYQMATNALGSTLWRLDTATGELEACGFEFSKPICTPFPAPSPKK
jgi:hypothetical protein